MSLSGDSRAEFCPERIDLFSQVPDACGVVQDHVSHPSALFPTGLRGNPGIGFSAREPVARHQPLDLSFMISIDGDNKIEVLLLAGLDQQRNDVHHNCCIAGSALQLGGPSLNGRVHNSLQIATRQRISEDNLGQAVLWSSCPSWTTSAPKRSVIAPAQGCPVRPPHGPVRRHR